MTEQEYAKKIREILKFEGIKIGDAEKIAGLHVGYLSRIAKEMVGWALTLLRLWQK